MPEAVNQPLKKTLLRHPCRWMAVQLKGRIGRKLSR
jgi:hypothetical protein